MFISLKQTLVLIVTIVVVPMNNDLTNSNAFINQQQLLPLPISPKNRCCYTSKQRCQFTQPKTQRGSSSIVQSLLPSQVVLSLSTERRMFYKIGIGKAKSIMHNQSTRTIRSKTLLVPSQLYLSSESRNLITTEPMKKIEGDGIITERLNSVVVVDADILATPNKRSRRRRRRNNTNKGKKPVTSNNHVINLESRSTTDWFNNSTKPKNLISTTSVDVVLANVTTGANLNTIQPLASITPLTIPPPRWLTSGNLPDIYWRSISMDHLRNHPKFHPLPVPSDIQQLQCLEDVNLFRQDSWQWDALHLGRCTTSQAVSALGFLEPDSAAALGIPRTWQKSISSTFIRLRHKPLRTLDEMNQVLCNHERNMIDNYKGKSTLDSNEAGKLWTANGMNTTGSNFAALYNYQTTKVDLARRRDHANKIKQNHEELGLRIRMLWGNSQEATALLTALNYFSKQDPTNRFYLKEIGMCGGGLDFNQTSTISIENMENISPLLVGATPDGVLYHADGSVEALEVKNHCPFYSNNFVANRKKTNQRRTTNNPFKRFSIGDRPFDGNNKNNNGVFSHYVPQLMMEMLCLGPECQSAVMVRQTATAGALILRMKRDDKWIEEMLYWLQKFQNEYVNCNQMPPRNFFYNNTQNHSEQSRYRRFINSTIEIRNKVKVVAHIPREEIQRSNDMNISLFLD